MFTRDVFFFYTVYQRSYVHSGEPIHLYTQGDPEDPMSALQEHVPTQLVGEQSEVNVLWWRTYIILSSRTFWTFILITRVPSSVIEHNEFSYTVFKAFLKYLYTDVVSLPLEEAVGKLNMWISTHCFLFIKKKKYLFLPAELLRLADVYCEENLKQHCIRIIKQKVCIENLHFLYDIALQYNAKVSWHFDLCYTHVYTLRAIFQELEHFCISIILDITSEVEQNEIEEPPTEDSPRLDINRIKTELIEAVNIIVYFHADFFWWICYARLYELCCILLW